MTQDGRFIQFKSHPDKSPPDGIKYALEPQLLKPLVSGAEAKRYVRPNTTTYVIFPYDVSQMPPRLWSSKEMEQQFPSVWTYLRRYEKALRARESGAFDDEQWYRFGRHQNIDKQHVVKLVVPRLVENLVCSVDEEGEFCLDNVDVGGILPRRDTPAFFLAGLLNSPVANFCFQRISKPFRGNFLSANRQFIAPLPIPGATPEEKRDVAELASALQEAHTQRRDAMVKLQERIDSQNCLDVNHTEEWLWADVKPIVDLKQEAPSRITASREKTAWAKADRQRRRDAHLEKLDAQLRTGIRLHASSEDDALHVRSGDTTLLTKYGLDPNDANFIAAIWTQILRTTNVTEKFDGKKLVSKLLSYRSTNDGGLRIAILSLHEKIDDLDRKIATSESKLNQLTYQLYNLSDEEIQLIESASKRLC